MPCVTGAAELVVLDLFSLTSQFTFTIAAACPAKS